MNRPATLRRTAARSLAPLALAAALLAACGEPPVPTEAERGRIEPAIRAYLEGMAASYHALDTRPLAGLAVPGLAERVRGNIDSIRSEGDHLEMKLLELEITHLAVLHHSTAVAECREVWDTTRLELGSERQIGRYEHSQMRTQVQLLLQKGAWIVYDRHRLDSPAAD